MLEESWVRQQAETTAATLQGLSVGHRAWFWFCPALRATPAALRLAPLRGAESPLAVEAQASALPIPRGAQRCVGVAAVAEDGAVEVASSLADASILSALAEWVQQYAPTHPALARLSGTRMIRVDPGGVVCERLAEAGLWAGLVRPPSPGDPGATLAALRPGEAAWIWGDGQGRVRMVPLQADPSGQALVQQVRGQEEAGVSGVLRCGEGGALALLSRAPLDAQEAMLMAAAARPGLSALAGARRVVTGQGRILAQRPGVDPLLYGALSALSVGDKVSFWLGDGEMLLGVEREALQAAAQGRRPQKMARGVARLSGRGWIEFRTKQDYPGFVEEVAHWAIAAQTRVPALKILKNARMTRRNDADEVIDRQRNDAAWAAMEGPDATPQ